MTMWVFEKQALQAGFRSVAGIDEAGRGPLAGPVVSAAVVLPRDFAVPGITDSKKLTPRKRDLFFDMISKEAVAVSTGIADVEEIDRINILQASLLSMARAVQGLDSQPDYLLIDGKFTIDYPLPPGGGGQRGCPKYLHCGSIHHCQGDPGSYHDVPAPSISPVWL